jgi:glycosyltransferase involved in cell wall biosynthesis
VVCSNIRGNVDLITNGKGGYLVDCHDIDGFAKAMSNIYENIINLDEMRKFNILSMKKFDTSEINIQMRKIYESFK